MWNKIIFLSIFAFTHSYTKSFELGGLMNGNRMAGVPLGMSLGTGELDVEGICTKSGMACQNCTLAVTCVPLPMGWLKVPLEECTDGFTCNAHLGKCTQDAVPECQATTQEFVHTCEQVGIFPDAYDCRKFHLCSPPEGLPDGRPADHRAAFCPRHYAYNPATAQCSIPIVNGQCSFKPVADCLTIGQHGVLFGSSNHYYVCLTRNKILFPQVFICPHGWHFWGGFCQPEPPPVYEVQVTEKPVQEEVSQASEVLVDNSQPEIPVSTEPERREKDDVSTRASVYHVDSFFSTEKAPTYSADTFLADRFDLSNYETTDDVQPTHDIFNSFESEDDFWQ
ncbi:uncharacterized protein LOC142974565 [Anticarsia gemmatalis]|uniref:uncharacterized protein LOC142974565 n=1 Tax=Anticarsia gemmatalis TaxID=129554 RepID=UPI003F75C634